jgi:hypothetical protein
MSRRFNRKTLAVLAAMFVVAAGAAYAYWTTTGTGSGSAATGTTAAVTVNQTNPAITGLYPGGPAAQLGGNFSNPNSGPAYVNDVSASVTATSDVNCDPAWFQVSGFPYSVDANVPTGTGGSWGSAATTVSMINTATNQDACKNATITISYTSN